MHYIFDLVFSAYEINVIGNSLITFWSYELQILNN